MNIEQQLADAGLGRVASQLALLAKETICLTPTKYEEEPTSRLGGRPNLAPDLAWPERDEEPLAFVAQLDLATIPEIAGLGLPRSGALYFFYRMVQYSQNRRARIGRNPATGEVIKIPAKKGAKPRGTRNFRVLYSAEGLATLPLYGFPNELEEEYRYQGVSLEAGRPELSMPFPGDPVLRPLYLQLEEQEQYLSVFSQLAESREVHAVGGYPNYIHHDPRLRAALSQAKGESVASKDDGTLLEKAETAMQDWQSLLLVDSEQSAGIVWGDMGRLHYLIRKDDLQKSAFENVWMEFDCY